MKRARGPANIEQYVAHVAVLAVKRHALGLETQLRQIHDAVEQTRPVDAKGLYSKVRRKVTLYFCNSCMDPCVKSRLKMCSDCSFQVCNDCPVVVGQFAKCSGCSTHLLCLRCRKKCETCDKLLCKQCAKTVQCSTCDGLVFQCDHHSPMNAVCVQCAEVEDQGLGEEILQ
jgi:hypothetical protein